MPGRILKMEELTSAEFAGLDRERTVILLPISPLEAHGMHLPLGVDYFNATFFAERVAMLLAERKPDYSAIIHPGIPLGASVYRLAGSVRTDGISIYRIIYQFGQSIATWGFKYILVVSGHGSPKHIVAVESACLRASKRFRIQMHNISGGLAIRFLQGEFIDRISEMMSTPIPEERRGLLRADLHGGWWETSMMLLLRPDLVKPEYKRLPGIERKKKDRGPSQGYYGSPALADPEFAEASMKVLSDEAFGILERILDGRSRHDETLSPIYKTLALRPHFMRNLSILLVLIILIIIALIISL